MTMGIINILPSSASRSIAYIDGADFKLSRGYTVNDTRLVYLNEAMDAANLTTKQRELFMENFNKQLR